MIVYLPTMLAFLRHSLILLIAFQLRVSSASQSGCSPSTKPSIGAKPPAYCYNSTSLHVNALIGRDNNTVIQCWGVQPDYFISSQTGTVGVKIQNLGDIAHASLIFFDPTNITFAGLHSAPAPQFVAFLSGGGYVRLPATNQTLPISTGTIIIANDTADVSPIGHDSVWCPGTVAMQLPFAHGQVNHTVLNDGPCECFADTFAAYFT